MAIPIFLFELNAQVEASSVLVKGLEEKATNGKLRAIRDLGSLLDEEEADQVIKAIEKSLLLNEEELKEVQAFKKAAFLSFFYENENKFQYSPILKAFYLKPLEEWNTPEFRIVPLKGNAPSTAQLLRLLDQATDEKEQQQYLESLVLKNSKESTAALTRLFYESKMDKKKYLELMSRSPNEYVFDQIIGGLTDGLLKSQEASILLSYMVNLETQDMATLAKKKAEAGSFQALRLKGYYEKSGILPAAFNEKVNYFALVLAEAPAKSSLWQNALDDLIASRNPRALFYLACNYYLAKKTQNESLARELYGKIKALIRLDIQLEEAPKDVLIYWAVHHKDYEWEEKTGVFINKKITKELYKSYERLFRRLSAKDEMVASAAYRQLTEGEPKQILRLSNKYRNVLRSIHPSLPSFRYRFLEQLVLLIDFAKNEGINYTADAPLDKNLAELKEELSPVKRFQIENNLIKRLSVSDLLVLEYEALLHSKNASFSFSISRVLDAVYANDWGEIESNEKELKAYLKKAAILGQIGTLGTCNQYFQRLDLSKPKVKQLIKSIEAASVDEVLIRSLAEWQADDSAQGLPVVFWEDPASLDARSIRNLAKPSVTEIKEIVYAVMRSEEELAIRNWMSYLLMKPRLEMTPLVFELLEQEGLPEVDLKRDLALKLLEKIYQFSFKKKGKKTIDTITDWQQWWLEQGAEYSSWGSGFVKRQIKQIEESGAIDVKLLNTVLQSAFYTETYRKPILEALKKLKRQDKVTRLKIKPKISLQSEWSYLKDIEFKHTKLDDLTKIVLINDDTLLVELLESKMNAYSSFEKGYVYNKLFKQDWFQKYVSKQNSGDWSKKLTTHLGAYLAGSDFLGEYEEHQLYWRLFLLENQDLDFSEKIKRLQESELPDGAKALVVQDLLSRVQYEDLKDVLLHFDALEQIDLKTSTTFLSKDFGLPVFDLTEGAKRSTFLKVLKEERKIKVYQSVLKGFGLDFLTKKGALDFNKINRILCFDAIEPFANTSGGRRDYYVYGLIKVLELQFGTRLGFEEKLNENQLFYSFTSKKRANAWRKYLIEQDLVKEQGFVSFYKDEI